MKSKKKKKKYEDKMEMEAADNMQHNQETTIIPCQKSIATIGHFFHNFSAFFPNSLQRLTSSKFLNIALNN